MTSTVTRREFLAFLGGAMGAASLPGCARLMVRSGTRGNAERFDFTPLRLPHPLPIYTERASFLPNGIGTGTIVAPSDAPNLPEYTIYDDVVLSPEYERYVIVRWGDRPFPNRDDYVGFNHDYTGFVPLTGNDDGLLWINHEYVSFPWSRLIPGLSKDLLESGAPDCFQIVVGFPLPADDQRQLFGEMLYNMGGSIVRIRKRDSRFQVVDGDTANRRLHGLSGLAINRERRDEYRRMTTWGRRAHQRGDDHFFVGTGPASIDVFPKSADGLGNRIIGTAYNCSGATTPWGSILTGEENFQGGVTEDVLPRGTQTKYTADTFGKMFGLVGEKYGWITEIDVRDSRRRPRKHTALGRFRHENVALRVEAGRPLIAYMGDDRNGGHTYKFVSRDRVVAPESGENGLLLENGTLYVARFDADGTGRWIPLTLATPTNPTSPAAISAAEREAIGGGSIDRCIVQLPRRKDVAGQTEDGGSIAVKVGNEDAVLPAYSGKVLGDFYSSLGAVLCDAFLASNLVGGTPCARPEDLEVHPLTREVFIAYTDGVSGKDGYPDSRVFRVGKYSKAVAAEQSHGGLYKIVERSTDGTGLEFTWACFLQSGEAGATRGAGFASLDNLLIDRRGTLIGVTDMSNDRQNGFKPGVEPEQTTIDHGVVSSGAESQNLLGVFGNNWLFLVPTTGPDAGHIVPLAYGPPRAEMTGPTLIGDTLIVSVQHPGEGCPINDGTAASHWQRDIEMLGLDGTLFTQRRSVPRGSNWPSNREGLEDGPPRPSTIGIVARDGRPAWHDSDPDEEA